MTAQTPIRSATAEGHTERVDAIACLDESTRRKAISERPTGPGHYLEIQSSGESLLIPIEEGVMHIGRGLSADLHLDEKSVSRLLDDRSSNGTFVNGQRIVQADLHNSDVILLGRVVLRYLEI